MATPTRRNRYADGQTAPVLRASAVNVVRSHLPAPAPAAWHSVRRTGFLLPVVFVLWYFRSRTLICCSSVFGVVPHWLPLVATVTCH